MFVLTDVTPRKQAQLALQESEQRFRAVFNQAYQHIMLLEVLKGFSLFTRLSDHSPDPREALTTVCEVTRLNWLNQAMKSALGMLSLRAPDWLRANARPHWYGRYTTGMHKFNAPPDPNQLAAETDRVGADIFRLLEAVNHHAPAEIANQDEIRLLNHLLMEHRSFNSAGLHRPAPQHIHCVCTHPEAFHAD